MSAGDWKAMFKAIQEGDFELVNYYLRVDIDPNYQHPEFLALPLSESIRYNHLDIAELLLKHGADPNIVEMESGITTMQLAQNMNHQQSIELIGKFITKG